MPNFRDEGEVNSDGEDCNAMIERIKVQSVTQANMTKEQILEMNDELYQLSDRARDPFSGRSNRRREGLYFDHLGRRRYKEPMKSSHDDRDRDRHRSDSRPGRERYSRNEYDKHRYQSDYRKDGKLRWVSLKKFFFQKYFFFH